MEQKTLLISSMQKLINHIVVSRKNQQEIFASLSRNDFKKIISNLQDDGQRLRKISLALITQLLYNNPTLKQKFCHIMNIPLVAGRICLNTKLASYSKENMAGDANRNIKEVFSLLKEPIRERQDQSLFWFISYEGRTDRKLQLQYVYINSPQSINLNQLLDPLHCMIGFVLHQRVHSKVQVHQQDGHTQKVAIEGRRGKSEYQSSTRGTQQLNNYFKPTFNKPEQTKYAQSSNLNQSLNIQPQGYVTDRQMVNKGGRRAVNVTMNQQQSLTIDPKLAAEMTPLPLNQFKNSSVDIQGMGRSKFAGIKLISNSGNIKVRQPKSYEDIGVLTPSPQLGGKIANQMITIGGKTVNSGLRERGYQTLRQKKIIDKYLL